MSKVLEWKADGIVLRELRTNEKEIRQLYDIDENQIYLAIYDMRSSVRFNAALGIAQTFMVCVVLSAGAGMFSKISNELVIHPIENMIEKVNAIARDPLAAANAEEERMLLEEYEDQMNPDFNGMDDEQINKIREKQKSQKDKKEVMETQIIEQTLCKIGGLLALVYGEAGSHIIAKNMEKGNEINPMLPGIKSMYIFGFCDIRCFTDTTEVLEEGVMIFVNEIGNIVHSIVNTFSGAANKNVGDAFLLVWKLDKQDIFHNELTETLSVVKSNRVSQLADMSVISFLLLISGLKKSKKMVKYNDHDGLNKRIPNYEVKLGLGLHLGYAIEGPIGSYYKIDASYLSPNVRMSERLEGATKTYGAPILVSGELHEHFSPATQSKCRQVDYVEMGGIPDPVKLFTIDVDPTMIPLEEEQILTAKE